MEKALREGEEQHRFLLETAQAVVWRGDPSMLRFTFVSREAQALLGYPVERWTEEPDFFREHVHPEDRDWALGSRVAAVREGRDHQVEFRMLAANGRVVWVRDMVRIVRDVQGRGIESVGVMIDVTERRLAEEELRQSREQLRDLSAHVEWAREEERATISRSIHDDLGQALTALKFELSALRAGAPRRAPLPESSCDRIDGMSELVMGTVDHVRQIAKELRPGLLDDLGLVAALEWQAQEFQARTEGRVPPALGARRHPPAAPAGHHLLPNRAGSAHERGAPRRRASGRGAASPTLRPARARDLGRRARDRDRRAPQRSFAGASGDEGTGPAAGGDVSITGTAGRGTTVPLSVPWAERGPRPA